MSGGGLWRANPPRGGLDELAVKAGVLAPVVKEGVTVGMRVATDKADAPLIYQATPAGEGQIQQAVVGGAGAWGQRALFVGAVVLAALAVRKLRKRKGAVRG